MSEPVVSLSKLRDVLGSVLEENGSLKYALADANDKVSSLIAVNDGLRDDVRARQLTIDSLRNELANEGLKFNNAYAEVETLRKTIIEKNKAFAEIEVAYYLAVSNASNQEPGEDKITFSFIVHVLGC